MPRLKAEVVIARESFVTQLAKEGKSAEEIQKALMEVGPGGPKGMRMFVPRLETLIREAGGVKVENVETAPISKPEPVAKPKAIAAPSEPIQTVEAKCSVPYGNKECGNNVLVPVGKVGNNLPVCSECKRSGIVAVVRKAA